jgi:NAD(P)-dependent dehydrogenase (short-subunit alcohol dehydrogenase family)
MMKAMKGKIGIVTGGESGIGKAIVRRMVADGATVVSADLSVAANSLTDEPLSRCRVDVSDPQSVDELVTRVEAQLGRIDFLVQSAGIGRLAPFLETTLETFDRVLSINLRGAFIVGQRVARTMRLQGGGAIVNIASVSGLLGNPERAAYASSKGGLIQLSRVMAVDLADYGIRTNVVAPGPVETPMGGNMVADENARRWKDRMPLRRFAVPEEICGAVTFLCSDDASFITGQVLAVDGGFTAAGIIAAPAGNQ